MDPKKRRLLYTLIAIAVVILLIIAVIYVGRHGTGGLFEANPSASSSPNTGEEDEPDVKTETLQEVKNPYDALKNGPQRTGTPGSSLVPLGKTWTKTGATRATIFYAET